MLRATLQSGKYAAIAAIPIAIGGAYYYRPLPDLSNGNWGGRAHYRPKKVSLDDVENVTFFTHSKQQQLKPVVIAENRYGGDIKSKMFRKNKSVTSLECIEEDDVINKASSQTYHTPSVPTRSSNEDHVERFEPILKLGHLLSQHITTTAINLIIYLGMNHYNKFHLVKNDNYDTLIESIQLLQKPATDKDNKETAVLTVSNHCSSIDDPTLFGAMLPPSISLFPSKLRWTMCSQEIGFKKPSLAAIFGCGKVLPIKRMSGINQPLLHRFAQKLAIGGQWVHVFPEGKVVQSGDVGENYFGTRSNDEAEAVGGRLKWGVGKLIAHCPVDVTVIPFHHVGMEGVVPQKLTGEALYMYPLGGNQVTLRVGRRIDFEDLIIEHESKHGPLYKYSATDDDEVRWARSRPCELILYSRITRRIELAIKELELESKADENDAVKAAYRKLRHV